MFAVESGKVERIFEAEAGGDFLDRHVREGAQQAVGFVEFNFNLILPDAAAGQLFKQMRQRRLAAGREGGGVFDGHGTGGVGVDAVEQQLDLIGFGAGDELAVGKGLNHQLQHAEHVVDLFGGKLGALRVGIDLLGRAVGRDGLSGTAELADHDEADAFAGEVDRDERFGEVAVAGIAERLFCFARAGKHFAVEGEAVVFPGFPEDAAVGADRAAAADADFRAVGRKESEAHVEQ